MEINNNPYAELENNFNNALAQNKELLEKQNKLQQDNIQKQVDFNVAELERNKQKVDTDLTKEGQAAYTDYMKANNPFSAQNENLFAQGLGNSGYAETVQSNNYNAYQNRYSNAYQQSVQAKKDFDVAIAQAKLTGDLEKAKIAQDKYNQEMQLLWQTQEFNAQMTDKKVNYKNWQDEFNYRKQQDAIQQQNWQTEQDRQQQRWQAEYDLQKKKIAEAQARARRAAAEAAKQRELKNNSKTQVNSNYDLNSISALGKGPLSDKGIENAVAKGEVNYGTNSRGQITFSKNPKPPKKGFTGISDFFKFKR